jgi:type II secretory pathway predicted ATPase ExeA
VYNEFYNLAHAPFQLTPNPAFFYRDHQHAEGLAQLFYETKSSPGLKLLTGAAGTGKTLLLQAFAATVGSNMPIVSLPYAPASPIDFFTSVLQGFQVPISPEHTESDLTTLLKDFLATRAEEAARCILLIDEAQDMSYELLECLSLWSCGTPGTRGFLQIVLAGSPELHTKLQLLEAAQVQVCIDVVYTLLPFDSTATGNYITHRLDVAGATHPVFTPAALEEIHRWSHGIPRLINILGDFALYLGQTVRQQPIDRDLIAQAGAKLGLPRPLADPGRAEPVEQSATETLGVPRHGQRAGAVPKSMPLPVGKAPSGPPLYAQLSARLQHIPPTPKKTRRSFYVSMGIGLVMGFSFLWSGIDNHTLSFTQIIGTSIQLPWTAISNAQVAIPGAEATGSSGVDEPSTAQNFSVLLPPANRQQPEPTIPEPLALSQPASYSQAAVIPALPDPRPSPQPFRPVRTARPAGLQRPPARFALTGTLAVDASPAGVVYFNGTQIAPAPLKLLEVPGGVHEVVLKYPDSEETKKVVIKPGKNTTVHFPSHKTFLSHASRK